MGLLFWILALASLMVAYFIGDNLRRLNGPFLRIVTLISVALLPLVALIVWLWGDPALGLGIAMGFAYYASWAAATLIGYFGGKQARHVC